MEAASETTSVHRRRVKMGRPTSIRQWLAEKCEMRAAEAWVPCDDEVNSVLGYLGGWKIGIAEAVIPHVVQLG